MCRLGDIIVVNKYTGEDGKDIGKHSFIVIDNNAGVIKGISYTFITTVISSFKNEKHKKRKLKYKENIEIVEFEKNDRQKNLRKLSYVKADKLFYFDKNKIDYYVLGRVSDEFLKELVKLVLELNEENSLKIITSNL
ncbi:MAG: hypothetical protein HFH47_01070 [Bacilli bacterium]|nr:hypothetical protein [Bacilli bacterium]